MIVDSRVKRTGSGLVLALVCVAVLSLLAATLMGSISQQTIAEGRLTLVARADSIAAAGVHIAMACLRRDPGFRERITGKLDGGEYVVTLEEGGQVDDPATVWVREEQYLKVHSRATLEGVTRRVDALMGMRSVFTEFAVYNAAVDTLPLTAPDGAPDLRNPAKPWNAAAMVAWASPGAKNPDSPANINRVAGRGYHAGAPPYWTGGHPKMPRGTVTGGPIYSQEWFPMHDFVVPVGLHTSSYILVHPDALGTAGVDTTGGHSVDLPIYSSDAITRIGGVYRPRDSLSVRYPTGHPRILDRDSPDGGGFLERPQFDWPFLRRIAQRKGIYINERGEVQFGFRGETSPNTSHAALYPVTGEVHYANSTVLPREGSYPGGRWSQMLVEGPFVDIGLPARHRSHDDVTRNPLLRENIPDSGILFSDCNIQLQGTVGKALTIFCPKNVMICGDVNCPEAGRGLAVPFAVCTGFDAVRHPVAGWSLDSPPPGAGGRRAEAGWLHFSTHKREGDYRAPRGRRPVDALGYLTSGRPDEFDICGVMIHSGGTFIDGYLRDPREPGSRRLEGASSVTLAGGHLEGAADNETAANYTREYTINIFGTYATDWGTHAEGGQLYSPRKNVDYDSRLLRNPPPYLPMSVNLVRWQRGEGADSAQILR